MGNKCDLVLKGGEVVDPAQGLRAKRDICFKDGKIAAVEDSLPRDAGSQVIDVSGNLVVPGLIDVHTHFAYGVAPFNVDPDPTFLSTGVTTAVDTGSTGWMNFPSLKKLVIEKARANLFAFVHLSSIGGLPISIGIPDLGDFRFARPKETIRCIEENRESILGVKVRLSPDGTTLENATAALEMARMIADETDSHVMIHIMNSMLPMSQVIEYLKPGDVITHALHGSTHNVLGDKGQVRSEIWDAYRGGIVFDTACAWQHYSIPLSKSAIEQRLIPHTLSTDITADWPGEPSPYDLPTIMSLYYALGMTLEEVIGGVTSNAASIIGDEELGTLRPGTVGDVAVLELEEGDFAFQDLLGNEVRTNHRFTPVLTVKDGEAWHR